MQTGAKYVFGGSQEVDYEDFLLLHTCSMIMRAPCRGRASRMLGIPLTWVDIPDNVQKPSLQLIASRPFDQVQVQPITIPPVVSPTINPSFLTDSTDVEDESQGPPLWNPQSDIGPDAQVTDDESQVQHEQQEPTETVDLPERDQRQFLDDDFVDFNPEGESTGAGDEQEEDESVPVVPQEDPHIGGFLSDSNEKLYDGLIIDDDVASITIPTVIPVPDHDSEAIPAVPYRKDIRWCQQSSGTSC
jgi:hypothetical protein